MKAALLFLLFFGSTHLYSQKLFIKTDTTFTSFGEYYFVSGNSLSSTSYGDSIFICRGAEVFTYEKSDLPYVINNGILIYPVLKVVPILDGSKPSYNRFQIASSKPRYNREFRAPPPRKFYAEPFFQPKLKYKQGMPVYLGFGADSTGSTIFLTIEDDTAQIFRMINCYDSPKSLFSIKRIPLQFPEGINKSPLITVIMHIWEDKEGIQLLYDGLHHMRISNDQLRVVKTFETKHSIIRERVTAFKVTHTLVETPKS